MGSSAYDAIVTSLFRISERGEKGEREAPKLLFIFQELWFGNQKIFLEMSNFLWENLKKKVVLKRPENKECGGTKLCNIQIWANTSSVPVVTKPKSQWKVERQRC